MLFGRALWCRWCALSSLLARLSVAFHIIMSIMRIPSKLSVPKEPVEFDPQVSVILVVHQQEIGLSSFPAGRFVITVTCGRDSKTPFLDYF